MVTSAGMKKIIRKKFLDHVALVAEADDEVVDAVVGINLHDVPEDRAAADFHHGLGARGSFFRQPAPKSTGKDDHLHMGLRYIILRLVRICGWGKCDLIELFIFITGGIIAEEAQSCVIRNQFSQQPIFRIVVGAED